MALALVASGCSLTSPKPDPIIITRVVKNELPPEVKKTVPALSPKPDRDLPEVEVGSLWAHDRTSRNIAVTRLNACIASSEGTR